jgi:hypothetical protein
VSSMTMPAPHHHLRPADTHYCAHGTRVDLVGDDLILTISDDSPLSHKQREVLEILFLATTRGLLPDFEALVEYGTPPEVVQEAQRRLLVSDVPIVQNDRVRDAGWRAS